MTLTGTKLSKDQAEAYDRIIEWLREAGVDVQRGRLKRARKRRRNVVAVLGRAGSGKTMLLSRVFRALDEAGVGLVTGDSQNESPKNRRTLSILAPTNKAASVLRSSGVPATTIHRILYTPVYDPEYQKVADWLASGGGRPAISGLTDAALDRAREFYRTNSSVPAALATAGLRGSDFITGWTRRDGLLDIGLVDEASMLDESALEDLRKIFPTLILFGDPGQLAPVGDTGEMVFDRLDRSRKLELSRIHRQATGNPILDLAHSLNDSDLEFEDFENRISQAAARDDRVTVCPRASTDLMARSPVLVWRNATRVRLIHAFRSAYGAPPDGLLPGEPLICDGIELPHSLRHRRIELEARGLIKGAQVIYLGPGNKPGFSRVHVMGAEDPRTGVASIVKIEVPDQEEPFIPIAARMGATFLHGAAVTVHKAQGSQWPVVQVFAPDIWAAARSGLVESGLHLWKRLAYVAVTRAQERLIWVTRYALARPAGQLATADLKTEPRRMETLIGDTEP